MTISGSVSCVTCRRTEGNDYLFSINHGGAEFWGVCQAQRLTRNHVAFDVQQLTFGARVSVDRRDQHVLRYDTKHCRYVRRDDGWPVPREWLDHDARRPLNADQRERVLESLDRSLTAAAALWSHMPDAAWLDDARALHQRLVNQARPPEHALVPASAEGALW